MTERILPGVSITEITEGLISAPVTGAVACKLVGTACKGPSEPVLFGSGEVQKFIKTYGPADPYQFSTSTTTNPPMELSLVRAGKLLFDVAPPGGVWACRAESGAVKAIGNKLTLDIAGNIVMTAQEAGGWFNNFYFKHLLNVDASGVSVTDVNTFWMYVPSFDCYDPKMDTTTARISANHFSGQEIAFEYHSETSGQTAEMGDFISQWTRSDNVLSQYFAITITSAGTSTSMVAQNTYVSIFTSADTVGGTNWSDTDTTSISTGVISAALEKLRGKEARVTVLAGANESTNYSGQIALGVAHVENASEENLEQMYVCGIDLYASQDTMVSSVLTESELQLSSERSIKVAPGLIQANPYRNKGSYDTLGVSLWDIPEVSSDTQITVSGGYMAALVAGVICRNAPDQSSMNKGLPISELEFDLTRTNQKRLAYDNFMLVVNDNGYRTLRDLSTSGAGTAFQYVSTRMAVDDVKRAIRLAGKPFVGKKINDRILAQLRNNLEGVLRRYVKREIIKPGPTLSVSSTREQQVNGVVEVIMRIQPMFYINFIEVSMILE